MPSKNNRTIQLTEEDKIELENDIVTEYQQNKSQIIHGDIYNILPQIPDHCANLILLDPPYNLDKDFNGFKFSSLKEHAYEKYLDSWLPLVVSKLKEDGSLYLCGDWKCSSSMQRVLSKYLTIINRITWQREKGRGAKNNWKNCMEDIWFAVADKNNYYFDVESVKIRKKVIAPYKTEDGKPKDWEKTDDGNFRMTYPSNIWTDITVPFWSMPENTPHPTQKPEKLYAKIILASSKPNDVILEPFAGSCTGCVVAKKLGRRYIGIEQDLEYCLYAAKRLRMSDEDKTIQGYENGIFSERNS